MNSAKNLIRELETPIAGTATEAAQIMLSKKKHRITEPAEAASFINSALLKMDGNSEGCVPHTYYLNGEVYTLTEILIITKNILVSMPKRGDNL